MRLLRQNPGSYTCNFAYNAHYFLCLLYAINSQYHHCKISGIHRSILYMSPMEEVLILMLFLPVEETCNIICFRNS